jgi:hypothetical protein
MGQQFIDHHPHGRVDQGAALAATAFFGGAGLVVNDDGATLDLAQFALHNAAALAACLWAGGCTWAILKALDALLPGGIRVDAAAEEAGLDLAEHSEEGYAFVSDVAAMIAAKPPPPAPAATFAAPAKGLTSLA